MKRFPAFWLTDAWQGRMLQPLAWAFSAAAARRRVRLERVASGLRRPVPVLVVGSIFVGGTGKTPLTEWLCRRAAELGARPGIVLRGYGGYAETWPVDVAPGTDPAMAGDEAVLLARRTGAPVVASPDRVAGRDRLIERFGCDLVISDDGLQHYRLPRDAEIGVLDHERGLGNGRCLPAGPLREPPARLEEVDMVVGNGGPVRGSPYWFELVAGVPLPVRADVAHDVPPAVGWRVHGVAGIGHPERFFDTLRSRGYRVVTHAMADHQVYDAEDLSFGDGDVIMTEKDAVKCQALDDGRLWYLPVEARPDAATAAALEALLHRLTGRGGGRTTA
ncbi:MAG TPA: tetraacyldisaccharide 4'-kinase [Gammaproteobacteria bacterium]|nr:tetraacyldisaccharide 4'-kinase [Gammaproteobacteria bacterium]